MNTIIKVIMGLMFVVAAVVWALVGLLFWIPLLTRATTVFSAMVVHATITGQKPDALRSHLESASRFYIDGFRIAFDVVHNPASNQLQPLQIRFVRVLAECIWTVVFWIILLTIVHATLLVPLWTAVSVASVTIRELLKEKWGVYAVGAIGSMLIFALGLIFGIRLSSRR